MKDIKLALSLKWYELLLVMVEMGLLIAGVWAFIDSLAIGSPVAAAKFFLLFVLWALPGAVVLFFLKPSEK